MNERIPAVHQPRRLDWRLCICFLLSLGLVVTTFNLLLTSLSAGVQVAVDDNGRLFIQSPATGTLLRIQHHETGILVSSPSGVVFNGAAASAIQVPIAAGNGQLASITLGTKPEVLTIQSEPGTDLTLHDKTAVLNLNSAADLNITLAQLDKPLAVQMAGEAMDKLTLGHVRAGSLAIRGGDVVFAGPVTTTREVAIVDSIDVLLKAAVSAPAGFGSSSATFTLGSGGQLNATAGDITLQAQQLQLTESRLHAAGDIRIFADETLTIRDSDGLPFMARAGGNLELQGDTLIDISALAHSASVLASGNDMTLRSAAPIRGDALYLAGGQYQIAQLNGRSGDLISPYDPIVLANGDVSLGSYTGASLHIVAGGSVLLDSVTITGTDSTANTINAANNTLFNGSDTIADLADLTLSNGTAVAVDGSASPLLDVRAGVDWSTFAGGPPGNQVLPPGAATPTFAPASGATINVNGTINVTQSEGLVLLTNQYRPNGALSGDINTADIDVSTVLIGQNGGDIIIDSRDNAVTGQLDAFAEVVGLAVSAGNGGTITVLAPAGTVTTAGDLNAYSRTPVNSSGPVGDGGSILLGASGGIDMNGGNGNVNTFTSANADGDAGDGGLIILATTSGDIRARTLNSASSTFTSTVTSSNGGDITVATGGGSITILGDGFFNGVSSYALSFGPGGNGGSVAMTATQGIDIGQAVRANSNGLNANGGDIHLNTSNGDISVGDVLAFASSNGDVGNGGSVSLQALNGAVTSGNIQAFTDSFFINNDAGDGGSILVQALNGDAQTGALESYTEARGLDGDTGDAGSIAVTASRGITATGDVFAYALAAINNNNSGIAGDGGDISLQATNAISIAGGVEGYSSAPGPNGIAADGGAIAIAATNEDIRIGDDVSSYASAAGFPSGDAGNGGSISLLAGTGIDVTEGQLNAYALSQEGTVGNGGNITAVTTGGNIVLELANTSARNQFAGNSLSTGNGGDITLSTGAGQITVNPNDMFVFNALNSESAGPDVTGDGGDIVVAATQGINLAGIVRSLASGATGNGGLISLTTSNGDIIAGDVLAAAIDNNDAPGSGGDVLLQASNGAVSTGDVLVYSLAFLINNNSQNGGNITVAALNGDVTTGQIASYTEARGLDGDTGNGGSIQVTTSGSLTTTGPVQAYALAAINNNNSGIAGDGGAVDLQAAGSISITGSIETYSAAPGPNGAAADAGDATVMAAGDVAFTYLDARARSATGTIGVGGTVNISTTQFVGATGSPFDSVETIAAYGLANSSAITITHGGAGSTPFVVGDAATNGVIGPLTTGDALITPTASFLYSHFEAPNIWILSVPHPLTLTKEATPNTNVLYRGEITYTLVLSNPAASAALGVTLSDTLPVEVDFNRWVQQPAGADVTADLLTWSGDVPANSALTFEFVVDHVGDAGDVFTNTAVFEHPASLGGGSASATVSIEEASNLGITKTVNVAAAVPGQTIQYSLAFANAGQGTARNVVITDVVPLELTNLSVTNSGAAITPIGGSTFAWAVQDLAPGQGGVITVTGDLVIPLARDLVITNTAVIAADPFEADPGDNEDSAPLTILNIPPQAVADTASTNEDTAVNIAVLDNDSDDNGDSLSLVAVGTPGNGAAVINGLTIDYTPGLNFNGTDTFTYTVGDGLLNSTALVTVTVNPQNDVPVALDNAYSTAEDTPLTIIAAAGVLSNDSDVDGDPLEAVLVNDVLVGALALAADGGFAYTPALNFTGPVTFTYQASDTLALSNLATVTITVGEANDGPIAVPDEATTDEDTAVTIDVLLNDSDPDNDTLAVIGTGDGTNGTTAIMTNQVVYMPAPNFNGTDVFTYTVSDGQLGATTAVTVTVLPVNDQPRFTSPPVTTAQEGASYTYTATAEDVDGNSQLTIQALVLPSWLALVDQGGGTAVMSGIPTAADVGDHLVTLEVSDGTMTDEQTFTITVSAAPEVHTIYMPLISNGVTPPVLPSDLVVTDLILAGGAVSVMVQNQGAGPTPDDFWLDVYVNPSEPPSLNRTWQLIAGQGLAWGVTDPIPAGGSLTLTIGDAYYDASESDFSGLVEGDVVWAQVDSVNLATTYGNVLEEDEANNIYGPTTYNPVGPVTGVARWKESR